MRKIRSCFRRPEAVSICSSSASFCSSPIVCRFSSTVSTGANAPEKVEPQKVESRGKQLPQWDGGDRIEPNAAATVRSCGWSRAGIVGLGEEGRGARDRTKVEARSGTMSGRA